jgi:hypothetical protein
MTLPETRKLGELIASAKVVRAGSANYPILSMTMRHGLNGLALS